MDLTIKEIQEKQRQLRNDILYKIRQFHKETGLHVTGEIQYGFKNGEDQHWLVLQYPNPFK